MSDSDIEFSDVDQPQRQQQLRPDRNRQYAVVTCGRVDEADLPVFVDIDALRDMERHALSDTRVELGGVMLGGQYEDADGNPFVVVSDSLRARHYENSKGSFKFTHDTWAEITRERDEFPPELQMVGWYHTHPDWGVFLSKMDLFICDHFFNRPLDIALVIDPCRGDRGWFQWTDDPNDRIRRTGGFLLFSSRHRQWELEGFASQLEGRPMLSHDPRATGFPAASGAYPAPVIQVAQPGTMWPMLATLILASMQFLLVAVLIWRLLLPTAGLAEGEPKEKKDAVAELAQRIDILVERQLAERDLESQRELLDRVVSQLGDGSTNGAVRLLEQQRLDIERLQTDERVYREAEQRVKLENDRLIAALDASESREKSLGKRVEALRKNLAEESAGKRDLAKQLAKVEKAAKGDDSDGDAEGGWLNLAAVPPWGWGLAGLVIGAASALGLVVSRPRGHEEPDWETGRPAEELQIDDKEHESEANNEP